ncbi:MAG TPA: hypothetical protein VLL07_05670, partial [Pontiella sp.]|nr:hypothetical protein [Pontiella sp.]
MAGLAVILAAQSLVMVRLCRRLEIPETKPAAESTRLDVQPKAAAGQITEPNDMQWNLMPPGIPQFDGPAYHSGTWDPVEEFRNMRQQMDQMFNDSFGRLRQNPDFKPLWGGTRFSPSMDVEEN